MLAFGCCTTWTLKQVCKRFQVYYENDRGEKLLKADCDGTVRITTETVSPDMCLPEMECYAYRKNIELQKLTFNVIPLPMSSTFNLQSEI